MRKIKIIFYGKNAMKIFKVVLIFLACLFLGNSAEAKVDPAYPDYPGMAVQDGVNPDPQQLIEGLKHRIKNDPYNYELYGALAFVCDQVGDYKQGLEAEKLQVKYLPEGAEGKDGYYGNLARAYLLNEMWEEGKEWLDKADEIEPHNLYNRWNAFQYYALYKKDFGSAALELKRMQDFYVDDADQYVEAYFKSLDNGMSYEDMTSLLEASVKLEPNNPKAHRALGMALRGSSGGDYEERMLLAVAEFKKALELDPQYIPAYISLGESFILLAMLKDKEANLQKALEWVDKAYEVDPQDLDLALAAGHLFLKRGEFDKAIEKLEFALEGGLENNALIDILAAAYNNKAYELYGAGQELDRGLSLIERALALRPDNGVLLGTKAELLYKMGEYKEAHKFIKQALALEPDIEEMQQDLVNIEKALGQNKGARHQKGDRCP